MNAEGTEKLKLFALIGIGALTLFNTGMILFGDSKKVEITGNVDTAPVVNTSTAAQPQNQNPQQQMMQQQMQDQINGVSNKPQDNVTPPEKATSIEFAEASHEFGKVTQGVPVKHTFKFTNTGDKPLIVEDTKGSCSCTVPSKPENPIPPGGTGEIVVEFKAKPNQTGKVNQTATIITNTNPKVHRLNISADVEPAK